mmetsp:Transcript_45879/g.143940  ORF Transcript_45879/g.143940 Transcript_45879/m.143940 type:complete len:202 (-) Transcript_45879:946-1551(-)
MASDYEGDCLGRGRQDVNGLYSSRPALVAVLHGVERLSLHGLDHHLLLHGHELALDLGERLQLHLLLPQQRSHRHDVFPVAGSDEAPLHDRQVGLVLVRDLPQLVLPFLVLLPDADGVEVDAGVQLPLVHDVVLESFLARLRRVLHLHPVQQRVDDPHVHHVHEHLAARSHLVLLLVLDGLVVLCALLGQHVARLADGVEL